MGVEYFAAVAVGFEPCGDYQQTFAPEVQTYGETTPCQQTV